MIKTESLEIKYYVIKKKKKPLAIIFTHILNQQKIPVKLKESVITPVPKKKKLRLVSNLNTVAKIFEGAIYSIISNYILNQISKKQHGLIKGRSTVTNLIEFCDYTARNLPNKQQIEL